MLKLINNKHLFKYLTSNINLPFKNSKFLNFLQSINTESERARN